MEDLSTYPGRSAAIARAQEYRLQAEAFRRLASGEPEEPRRRLLALSATKYDEAADAEERLIAGVAAEGRSWALPP